MNEFVQFLISGFERGSAYALWAVGYGLVYQVLGLMHFAHGDTLLLVLYMAFTFITMLALPIYVALPLSMLVGALLAVVIERSIYRPLVKRNDAISAFIAALGAAYILRNVATLIWGRQAKIFPPAFPSVTFVVGDIRVNSTPFLVLAMAIVVVFFFVQFLKRNRHGQAITAIAQDRSTAALMGINVPVTVTMVYALSGAIGAVGAVMFAATFGSLNDSVGFFITMKAFIAAVIGGIGRIEGAVLGGLLLGMIEAMTVGYVSGVFVDAITVSILGIFLVVRPVGILGRKQLVKL